MTQTQRKTVRLTPEQADALVRLRRGGAQTPFELRHSIATLYALAEAGYVSGPRVERHERKGQPHHRLRWGINSQGALVARAVLRQQGDAA